MPSSVLTVHDSRFLWMQRQTASSKTLSESLEHKFGFFTGSAVHHCIVGAPTEVGPRKHCCALTMQTPQKPKDCCALAMQTASRSRDSNVT